MSSLIGRQAVNKHTPEQARRGSPFGLHAEPLRLEDRQRLAPLEGVTPRVFDHVENFTCNRKLIALLTHTYLNRAAALIRIAAYYQLDAYGFAEGWRSPGQGCSVLCVRPSQHRDRLAAFPWAARELVDLDEPPQRAEETARTRDAADSAF